jgi:hypothetical protein
VPAATTRRGASLSTRPLRYREVSADRAAELVAAGAEPLRDLIGAMHAKMLLAELARQRG